MIDISGSRLYKYNYVIARLRQDIREGNFGPDGRIPPERQLSENYAVSRITIRSALKQLRHEGLLDQCQGRGTFLKLKPDHPAPPRRKESAKRTFRVLFTSRETKTSIDIDPYYTQLFLGFHRYRSPEYDFVIESHLISPTERFSDYIRRQRIDIAAYQGVLSAKPLEDGDIDLLDSFAVPYVSLGQPESYRSIPMVDIDNFHGMFLAAEHLMRRGCRRPLLLYNGHTEPNLITRLSGFHAALRRYGREADPELEILISADQNLGAERAIDEALAAGRRFDSVLVLGDWATVGAMNALKRHHLKVPDTIKLAVFGSFPWLQGLKPSPTSVFQPFQLMAEKALEMLSGLTGGPMDCVPHMLIRPQLVEGDST